MRDDEFPSNRTASCVGKITYRNARDAAKAKLAQCRRKNASPRPMLDVYRCHFCSLWHLGRKPEANMKAKRRARDLFRAKHP